MRNLIPVTFAIENSYVCEDIKEEIKVEESVDGPLTIHEETENINICEDIKKDVKKEESVEVYSFNQQEIGNTNLGIYFKIFKA